MCMLYNLFLLSNVPGIKHLDIMLQQIESNKRKYIFFLCGDFSVCLYFCLLEKLSWGRSCDTDNVLNTFFAIKYTLICLS